MTVLSVDPVRLAYVLAFGVAAVACFAALGRTRRIDDTDTRRGLVALLLASGAWATAHVLFLLAPTPTLAYWLYAAGLVVGFAAVGPWLYFCSAYTGRTLHRNPTIRRAAVVVFVGVVAVKLTNPIHGGYYSTAFVSSPFPHLAVTHHLAHWLVMGLSYVLAAIGYFMLFELFTRVGYRTAPLHGLVALTGLPLLLDVVGFASGSLVDITYEPLGVAAFAVGTLFVYLDRFQSVRLAGLSDEPVVVLTEDDRLWDFNDAAAALFPSLDRAAVGEPVRSALPAVAEVLGTEEPVVAIERDGADRYYRVTETTLGADGTGVARQIAVVDVTHSERYRRELERQNDRLARFASVVSHDLRNPLNVARGRLEMARADRDDENLETAATAVERIGVLVDDLLSLARQGQPIDETEPTSLSALADRSWRVIDAPEATFEVSGDLDFEADPDRTQQLLENLLRNALDHGAPDATIRVGPLADGDGFFVEDDGPGIPPAERGDVFESGYTTAEDGTGFGLAIVSEVVEAHGWAIEVAESEWGGARFEISGVETDEH